MDVDEGNEKQITIVDLINYIAPTIECCYDTPNPGGPVDNLLTPRNLWILGAPISHSHVSYIETHSCIFNSQYTKIYDRL